MERIVEQSLLYDFYGELLNEHQREIYEDAVFQDLSLSEIAQDKGISRQAVHDVIKRCNVALEEYEGKLHLLKRFLAVKENVRQIQVLAKEYEQNRNHELISEIEKISNEILEEL